MDRPRDITLSEISQTEKNKHHDVAYMWNQKTNKKDTNEPIHKTEINAQT